jgi:hypothetical protein
VAAVVVTVPPTSRCPLPSMSPHAGEASISFPHPACRHKYPKNGKGKVLCPANKKKKKIQKKQRNR